MIDSIVRHLERILNTRQGSVQIADDYGIPDFTDTSSGFSDTVRDLERTIRNTIQKYEPRLKSVRVKVVPQEETTLTVSFQIVGRYGFRRKIYDQGIRGWQRTALHK